MGDECGASAKGSPLLEARKPFWLEHAGFSVEGGTVVAEEQMDGLVVYEMKPCNSCTLF